MDKVEELLNGIDKRLAVLESTQSTLWEKHDTDAQEHRKYVHGSFHEVKTSIATIILQLANLPCKVRDERYKNHEIHIRCLWIVLFFLVCGLITIAYDVILKR